MKYTPLDTCRKIPAHLPVALLAHQILRSPTGMAAVSRAESEAVLVPWSV